ncbi:MAG: MBL fold metallo-hydrolase [Planctomycetes bacterium]|nr:MBL fold metallo-hydrolase [Planctomycetota bacterium]
MVILERTMHPGWLSNSWLIGDHDGGHAVLIDSGGPMEPLVAAIEAHRLTLTHVLCTHHHPDHVAHNADWKATTGCAICGGRLERDLFRDLDVELEDGQELRSGDLRVRVVFTPGHTKGQVAFSIDDTLLATGDTLFRGSIGGTRGNGHGTYEQIRQSILDTLLRFPKETRILPGHCDMTSVGRELEENPFVRFWTGREPSTDTPCLALGQPARMLVRARDYDGGTKCLVRFDDGTTDVVPGSRVVSAEA